MSRRGLAGYRQGGPGIAPLLFALLIALVSTGAVLRTYALPAEARNTVSWYAYRSTIGFDFVANVKPSTFYPGSAMRPDRLAKAKLPVEPPQFRRLVLSKFADSVQVSIPYRYEADRPANLKGTLKVDGLLQVPGLWEKPFPLGQDKVLEVQGREISGVATFEIPVAQLLADQEAARSQFGVTLDPLDLVIQPTLQVEAGGLQEPVAVVNNLEFRISVRPMVVELDDPREARVERTLQETRVTPIVVPILGIDVPVATLRQIAIGTLAASLMAALLLGWRRRSRQTDLDQLQKLGPHLITIDTFQLPHDTAVADVSTAHEMLRLHTQTDRPVIQAGNTYYLLDGTTCYRLDLNNRAGGPRLVIRPEEELEQVARSVHAENFTLDPWITEVQIHSAADILQLHASTGKTIIRTRKGYHLLEGTVCYTYRPLPPDDVAREEAAPAEDCPCEDVPSADCPAGGAEEV